MQRQFGSTSNNILPFRLATESESTDIHPSPVESLRLLNAFFEIEDASVRAEVIGLAERHRRQPRT
jgi:hypothetical protein